MQKIDDIAYLKAFGENLKKKRKSKGFTQEQLANDLNVEISQISRLERGILNTSVLNLKKITVALDISIAELFDFEEQIDSTIHL